MNGVLTLSDTLFQANSNGDAEDDQPEDYNSAPRMAQIYKLSSSRFTRRY